MVKWKTDKQRIMNARNNGLNMAQVGLKSLNAVKK